MDKEYFYTHITNIFEVSITSNTDNDILWNAFEDFRLQHISEHALEKFDEKSILKIFSDSFLIGRNF